MTTRAKKPGAKPGTKKNDSGRKVPVLFIAFGAIALLLVAAISLSGEDPIGSGGEYGEPTIEGAPLLPMEGGVSVVDADPAIGVVAPEVTGQDFNDETVTIAHDGTPKAIVFIAHWCSHCRAEVPRVQDWLDAGGGVAGVEIMSVTTSATSGQPNWPPSEWLASEGWTPGNIRDDQESSVLRAYGGSSFPYWVFLNGDGTVAARVAGETDIETLSLVMGTLQSGS